MNIPFSIHYPPPPVRVLPFSSTVKMLMGPAPDPGGSYTDPWACTSALEKDKLSTILPWLHSNN